MLPQDRHIPTHSKNGEPWLDPLQDYVLLLGNENATHTILRFRRRMSTCDEKYDVSITVSFVTWTSERLGDIYSLALCVACERSSGLSFQFSNIFANNDLTFTCKCLEPLPLKVRREKATETFFLRSRASHFSQLSLAFQHISTSNIQWIVIW